MKVQEFRGMAKCQDIPTFRMTMSLPSSVTNQLSNCSDDGDEGSELQMIQYPARIQYMNTTLGTRNLSNEGTSLNTCYS